MTIAPDRTPAITQDAPSLHRRLWRHILIWVALLVAVSGSYLGSYQWGFKPRVRNITGSYEPGDWACYFYGPLAWAEYQWAERRTRNYLPSLWRLAAGYPLDSSTAETGPDAHRNSDAEEGANQDHDGWLWIEWTGHENELGWPEARCILKPPKGDGDSDQGAYPAEFLRFASSLDGFRFTRDGILFAVQETRFQNLSSTAPGMFRFVALNTDNFSLSNSENWQQELLVIPWPCRTALEPSSGSSADTPPDLLRTSEEDRLGLVIFKRDFNAVSRRFIGTRVTEDDPDRATILEEMKKSTETPATPPVPPAPHPE